jgi:hypothetical protein
MVDDFKKIIFEGLKKAQIRNVDIFTFALYHDHESHVVTVCIDTIESSKRNVLSSNSFSKQQFLNAIENGNIESAKLWNANGGRSFSLGDFAIVNASEIDVPRKPSKDTFYMAMAQALEEMRDLIEQQSSHGKSLMFCCSTEDSEVGLVWS